MGDKSRSRTTSGTSEAAQQSEALVRALLTSIRQKVFLKDRNSIYLAVNEIYASSLGCTPEEVVGKDDFAFFPTELAEQYRADDRAVMESGQGKVIDERYVVQDREYWIRTNKSPVRDDAGQVTGVLGLFEDMTEETLAKQALEVSEARYRHLFEATKDGVLILDGDSGRVLDVNASLLEFTGYTRDALLDQCVWDLGLFGDEAASRQFFAGLLDRPHVRHEDFLLIGRGGWKIDVEFVSSVYSVNDQAVVQCTVRDASERQRLATERERLAMAMEQSGEVVMITDLQGDIVYTNPAFESVTGYSREEVLGRNPRLLNSGEQDAEFYRAMWSKVSAGESWHGRLVNKKKDGTQYTEDATISPVRNSAGAITSYVAVKRDITPLLALEAQFFQAQKMESIGRLAGGVAHDFNNLLTVILSFTGLVLEELEAGDSRRDDLQAVKEAGERATRLTRQLLAFGRKQVLQPEVLDLNRILVEMDKMLGRIIGEDIRLEWVRAPSLGLVKADPGQLEQVVMNLAVNARDAMPEGGRLTIETANVVLDEQDVEGRLTVQPGAYVMLAVSDTGVGMDKATRASVFEPFFTTKKRGKGTGLGLSTVFGIVKQSGGNIWLYSEPGKGTTFKIYLPRESASEAAPAAKSSTTPPRSFGSETILVVEDEASLRKVVGRMLEAAGYTVLAASTGAQALTLAAKHPGEIHLLLTDVVMPKMSGAAVAKKLAATGRSPAVLYMSGYADDAIVHHGVLAAGLHFLSKPFSGADLTRKVREVLAAGSHSGRQSDARD